MAHRVPWSSDVLRDHAARLTNAEPNEPASGFLASTSAYLMLDTVPVSSAQVL
jgi:hypothetical protein